MAGVGRGKRRGWPAAQELDRMRARQVQRLAAPELEQRRARSVAAGPAEARADAGVAGGGGWPRGSPSNGRCGRGGSRERRWSEQGSKETAGRVRLRAAQEGGRQPMAEASPRDGDGGGTR